MIEIIKNNYPMYWEDNKAFLNGLQQIQEFRNKLAHSVVDVTDEALSRPLDEGVGFVQWKKGAPVTDQEFEDWEVKAKMVSSSLSDIKRLLPFKEAQVP